jgi:hypothetical protein
LLSVLPDSDLEVEVELDFEEEVELLLEVGTSELFEGGVVETLLEPELFALDLKLSLLSD